MANETPAPAAAPKVATSNGMTQAELEKKAAAEVEAKAKQARAQKATAPKTTTQHVHRSDADKFSLLRPFRYLRGFVKGTVRYTLDGIARGGRIGLLTGLAMGVIATVGMGVGAAPMLLIGLPVLTALAFIGIGGALGIVTGGVRGVRREMHREDCGHMHTVVQRSTKRGAPAAQGSNLRAVTNAYFDEQDERSEINFDRMQQQDRENRVDDSTYWQNSVSGDSQGWGKGQ